MAKSFPKGCYKDCKCDHYCVVRAQAASYVEHDEKLNLPWKSPHFCTVTERTKLQYCGVELTLLPDGTYELSDTTGG